MTAVLAMLVVLSGHVGANERLYARAILAATRNRTEQRLLVVIAYAETRFKPRGRDGTPPFGVTDWARVHRTRRISVRHGARIALHALRFIRLVRCPGAPWSVVLGRYHHGNGTRDRGCYEDGLARIQVTWLRMIDQRTRRPRRTR